MPIGPPWLQEMGRDATALGGVGWLAFCTGVVAGYLWLDQRRRMMVFLLAAILGGLLVSGGLKQLFNRPRPDVVPHLSHVFTTSFPSGHSLLSAVVYLTLGSLLAASVSRRRLKAYFITVALLLTFFVGISRVYLGVHYPTDVLAGWMAGLIWALMCWMTAHWLQTRGRVEQPQHAMEPGHALGRAGRARLSNRLRASPHIRSLDLVVLAVFPVHDLVQVPSAIVPVLHRALLPMMMQQIHVEVVDDHRFDVRVALSRDGIAGELHIGRCVDA